MAAPSANRTFLRTLLLVFLAMAGLFGVDTFLASQEHRETMVEANRLYDDGHRLMAKGKNAEAIDRFKDALAIQHDNREYLRALAQAQFAGGKISDAEGTLSTILQSDSTDALSNLILARVLVKEDRFAEAVSYFHRAIYGHWSENAPENRLQVRFELVDLLAQRNSKEELLAELLPLQNAAANDRATQARIGRLFLQVGSAARAADVYRGLLQEHPDDAAAHAGLGQAEFVRANYRAAERDFQSALRLQPDDHATEQRLELARAVIQLDPTVRGLNPDERYRRSLQVVEQTAAETGQCIGVSPPADTQALLERAAAALKARVSAARESEMAESNVDLAEQIWQARKKECKAPPVADSPLALVLARSAQ